MAEKKLSRPKWIAHQGYLPGNKRPMCGNCANHEDGRRYLALVCKPGGHQVSASAWCPSWNPVAQWLEANPNAVKALGRLNFAINDGKEEAPCTPA